MESIEQLKRKTQEEGNKIMQDFLNKIVFYSAGILTSSFTLYIAFIGNNISMDIKIFFLFIWGFSLSAIIFGIFSIRLSAYSKFIEVTIHGLEKNSSNYKKQTKLHKTFLTTLNIFIYLVIISFLLNCIFMIILGINI